MNAPAAQGHPSIASATRPAIDIRDLRFRWQTDRPLVLDLPVLAVRRGERVFVKGPSGSGKSTLLNLIGGVLQPVAGRVRVLGECLDALGASGRDRFRADHIGFVFQMFNLIPYLSVLENVLLPCRFSRRRTATLAADGQNPDAEARRLLSDLGLGGADLHRRASELSVGQQQRVAAARALIGRPELLVADEPTSALDTDHRAGFIRLLLEECAQSATTVVFVSHDISLQAAFDRCIDLQAVNRAATGAAP